MNWETVKLGEIAETSSGGTPNRSIEKYWVGGSIPWIKSGQLKDCIIDGAEEYISEEGLQNSSAKFFKKGTLLLALYGATAGKLGFLGLDATTNQAICAIVPKYGNLNTKYLYYYLLTKRNEIIIDSAGGAQPNISQNYVQQIKIPLPPLPIQRRIAEILDAADALRRKDQELLQKYDELAQAIFIDMFGDPVKNEKGFKFVMLGDCLDNIQIGPFGTQLHESDYIKNGIPVINPMHIGDLKIKPNYNYSISEEKYYELPQYHLKENDIILGRRGEMGRCAIVTKNQGKCLCGTGSLYLTVKNELLDPLFLVYVLSRKSTKIALENVSAGTTMANLNKSIINDFKIILPNIEKQRDFVKAVKLSEESIEHTMGLIDKSAIIFNSLLQKAFKGELEKE